MNRRIFLPVIGILLFASCNQIYKEYDKDSFTTLSWKQGREINFYPVIEDVSKSYELILGIRHTYGAQIKRIDVSVKTISPSGKEFTKQYGFNVLDSKGEHLASCAGNMCDLETVVDENLQFSEPGKYHFVITPNGAQQRISGIMEFGLIISEKH